MSILFVAVGLFDHRVKEKDVPLAYAYQVSCQTSKMERFCKSSLLLKVVNFFRKNSPSHRCLAGS